MLLCWLPRSCLGEQLHRLYGRHGIRSVWSRRSRSRPDSNHRQHFVNFVTVSVGYGVLYLLPVLTSSSLPSDRRSPSGGRFNIFDTRQKSHEFSARLRAVCKFSGRKARNWCSDCFHLSPTRSGRSLAAWPRPTSTFNNKDAGFRSLRESEASTSF